ncbi:MAG: hypothetical protein DHS20C15_03330 [Planctomycetota bacterium]|nr:MAG: hypothetical protein DHS20C15_03330 [Planctomycetota bacterium]
MSEKTFTGRKRHGTRLSVRLAEWASSAMITVGGLGTILAVALIFVFLVWVVLPLFGAAEVGDAQQTAIASANDGATWHAHVDPSRQMLVVIDARGHARVHHLATGDLLEERALVTQAPTAFNVTPGGEQLVFGFGDGSVTTAELAFDTTFLSADAPLDDAIVALQPGESIAVGASVVERTREGVLRQLRFEPWVEDPFDTGAGVPIRLADRVDSGSRTVWVTFDDSERLRHLEVRSSKNLLTGKITRRAKERALSYATGLRAAPTRLLLSGQGDNLYLGWADGRLERHDLSDADDPRVAEVLDVAEGEASVTALGFLLGRSTLLVGDSDGRLSAWFRIKPDDAGTPDGALLVEAHTLLESGPAITSLAPSPRTRLLALGDADGGVRLLHVTSQQELAYLPPTPDSQGDAHLRAVVMAPKEDALVLLGTRQITQRLLDPKHPEAALGSLFGTVWYEGYTDPQHVWQSSSGSDDFEEKLGLMPLIFGTLKATFYSMLFGAPLALLAAIFTSEFLSRRVRTPIKSAIEMMASLPSVVLGFLAALVIAPFVENVLPIILASFLCVPMCLWLGAQLWQLLPAASAVRLAGMPRLLGITAALLVGASLSVLVGPALEALCFGGDLILWLDGQGGGGAGGWFFLLLPLALLATAMIEGRTVQLRRRGARRNATRQGMARLDLLRAALIVVGGGVLAFLVSQALSGVGLDPRGGVVDTYVQRNALIVGFVMGFAVIPIIYTLAEDALNSVPEHLRLASLGAGATQWQTATRVIVPAAMSGLFSALMIGLGRAVGETMIVLMATGNTAVMEWNVFNGFRTLSANIAVELPEAVRGSTHYRTLFLAALVLFAMTFVLNTLAEVVRARFRKRAVQL